MGNLVYYIRDNDAVRFVKVLEDYYRYYCDNTETAAKELAKVGYNNLISGNDLDGKPVTNSNLVYFDELLSIVTHNYYTPSQTSRNRYKKNARPKTGRPKKPQTSEPIFEDADKDTKAKITKIKENLLTEYPTLNRVDLEESIDNYCKLIVKINDLMSTSVVENNVAIKNLTDTQIKLGNFLGIDEGQKAKQKAIEDKQSVASLSVKFQDTLNEFPQIMDRMRYKEIRILLEKFDRGELSRGLFENPSYAGIPIQEAREFVKEREKHYEAN